MSNIWNGPKPLDIGVSDWTYFSDSIIVATYNCHENFLCIPVQIPTGLDNKMTFGDTQVETNMNKQELHNS